jgi:MYXO-CTERM domain-containing protein
VVVTNGAGEVTSGLVRVEVEPAPLPDAGVATGDAGASTGDAGASADDAGRTDLDGGAAADDAAADPEAETVANGYGVSASGGACSLARTGGGDAQGFALVLLALGLLVRRRRARR